MVRVWGRFWEGFGVFLASIGPLLVSFLDARILNGFQTGLGRFLRWILAPFGEVWEGPGEDFGMFWEFGTQKDSWKHLGSSHGDNLALSGVSLLLQS